MSPLMQDARAVPGAPLAGAPAGSLLAAATRALARLARRFVAERARRSARRAEQAQARVMYAAREACAVEGATVEFDVVVFDGRRYGALYVDGKLNCLLPDLGRL
jgi:hypothetical protein